MKYRGLLQHLLLTLRLNFRTRQALIYGYLVPLFFLVAFGSVFGSNKPPLLREMGQLLTITILGGACFGMPTAMVAERERGVWRRYRLLPTATAGIILSAMVGRLFLVASAGLMQIGLARWIYATPFPQHPLAMALAFAVASFAFLGLGLIIAMLADTVPAVQALGQAIFLPMIMIGGVGVPLRVLPEWARYLASFLPGRYAVELLSACMNGRGLAGGGFSIVALLVIGVTACLAGAKMFRWDVAQPIEPARRAWLGLALVAWVMIGLTAERMRRVESPAISPVSSTQPAASHPQAAWELIATADIDTISFDDLPDDLSPVTPFAPNLDDLQEIDRKTLEQFGEKLDGWPPAQVDDMGQRVRNCLCVCGVVDLLQDGLEAHLPLIVLKHLEDRVPRQSLEKALAYVALHPDRGSVRMSISELGVEGEVGDEAELRQRTAIYAKKMLKRLRENVQ